MTDILMVTNVKPATVLARDQGCVIPLLKDLSIELVELLPPELSGDHLVEIDWSRGGRSSLTLWKLFLFIFPLLDAVRDVDGDALGAKVSAADVARHGHGQSSEVTQLVRGSQTGNHWQVSTAAV